jgi:hypothetical protein
VPDVQNGNKHENIHCIVMAIGNSHEGIERGIGRVRVGYLKEG